MATRDQVKQWFQTGDYPTQAQFYAFFDAVLFHGEVQMSDVSGLNTMLQEKATKAALDAFQEGDRITLAADGHYDLPAGFIIEKVMVIPSTAQALRVSTVEGDADVGEYEIAPPGESLAFDFWALSATRRLYLTGITNTTDFIFFKRKFKSA